MDIRYSHPEVVRLWSREWTYNAWLDIEIATLQAQLDQGVIADQGAFELFRWLQKVSINEGEVANIALIEKETKHDVVAFLKRIRDARGEVDARWLHYGLTSSDVVDTAQGMRFRKMKHMILSALGHLVNEVTGWTLDETPLVGRTHGQPAELTTMRVRAMHWVATLAPIGGDLCKSTSRNAVCKLSGPVGTFAHNPPEIEQAVARNLNLRPVGAGASQIAPRSALAAWANSAAGVVQACAKIAMDLRLMNLLGEAGWPQTDGQVGSSSMAHKNNPIVAEQIRGMAQMATGYASMLQPLDLWLERDISHSSVERVAVPDLWHVTLHAISQTTEMLRTLKVGGSVIGDFPETLVTRRTLLRIDGGDDVETARRNALAGVDLEYNQPDEVDAELAIQNYPSSM